MMIASKSIPGEPRGTVSRKSILSIWRTFLLDWGKGSKAVMAGLILGGSLLGTGQEAAAEKDRNHGGGGWINPDQRVIPRGGGWVTPSQGWVTPSQGWVTPSQGWVNPNQNWDNSNRRDIYPNHRWDHRGRDGRRWEDSHQREVPPHQGWDHRGRDSGVRR